MGRPRPPLGDSQSRSMMGNKESKPDACASVLGIFHADGRSTRWMHSMDACLVEC